MGVLTKARVAMVAAEFLGAGLLTLTALAISSSDLPIAFFVAAGVGAVYALVVVAFGSTSQAHANPAVSIAMWSIGRLSTLRLLAYVASQLTGAVLAYRLFLTMSKIESVDPFVWPDFGQGGDFWLVLVAELIGTFLFTIVISAAAAKRYEGARLAGVVGLALFAGILLASIVPKSLDTLSRGESRFHGGTVNPVVAIGTQNYGWEYVLGPVAGAVAGVYTYSYLFSGDSSWKIRRYSAATTAVVSRSASSKPKTAVKKTAKKSSRKR